MRDPREQLQLLAYAHFAVAGLCVMVSLAPLVLGFVGSELAAPGGEAGMRAGGERMVAAVPFGCSVTLLFAGLVMGAAIAAAGGFLMGARRRGFCRVVAALALVFIPFGTALGAVTLGVLARPEVAALFEPG